MRQNAHYLIAGLAFATALTAFSVEAAAYRRPQDAAVPAAPSSYSLSAPGAEARQTGFAWNGMEAPAYSYGYALNLPPDGNWRWIEARCYSSRSGETCVDGHWTRRQPGRCEEVTSHSVRQGRYIRIVPAGPVNTCRR